MTPSKWYQDLYITMVCSPFYWQWRADRDVGFRSACLAVGPFAFFVGWPDLSTQPQN
jgi:hypothetical protein